MKETINYKLKKPDLTDYVNIGDLNKNADIVDAELKKQSNEASNHKEDITSQEGRHGLRYWDRKLEIRIDGEWVEYKRIPVGTVKDFVAYPKSTQVALTWTDPGDLILDGATIANWKGTKIVRKIGSYPQNENDGALVLDNNVLNKYKDVKFIDSGLSSGATYYYSAFPYTDSNVFGDKTDAMVADDSSGSPGSSVLLAGTMDAGFFGEVTSAEMFTASGMASAVGLTEGSARNENEPWLKFASGGKIIFRPRKQIRSYLMWNDINKVNAVHGGPDGATVSKNGINYRVRLMRSSSTATGTKGSEWNKLMLPIHENAIYGNWSYPGYVESNIPVWPHKYGTGLNGMYSDKDLSTDMIYGDGSEIFQQGDAGTLSDDRVTRGGDGVSSGGLWARGRLSSDGHQGWAPVLELI